MKNWMIELFFPPSFKKLATPKKNGPKRKKNERRPDLKKKMPHCSSLSIDHAKC